MLFSLPSFRAMLTLTGKELYTPSLGIWGAMGCSECSETANSKPLVLHVLVTFALFPQKTLVRCLQKPVPVMLEATDALRHIGVYP